MTKDIERKALITEIDHFINEAKKSYIVERWAVSYENSNPFSHTINDKNEVWWMKAQARQLWEFWQAAKAQAVPEKDAVIKKLSDQLYAQEMKASAARVLCETACELLDDYAHQDAMVILNDLEQAMKEPAND